MSYCFLWGMFFVRLYYQNSQVIGNVVFSIRRQSKRGMDCSWYAVTGARMLFICRGISQWIYDYKNFRKQIVIKSFNGPIVISFSCPMISFRGCVSVRQCRTRQNSENLIPNKSSQISGLTDRIYTYYFTCERFSSPLLRCYNNSLKRQRRTARGNWKRNYLSRTF